MNYNSKIKFYMEITEIEILRIMDDKNYNGKFDNLSLEEYNLENVS